MASRRDGIESRKRLLEAAAEVFALKGYRRATVAQICRRAGSNVAAVNYHFRSKDELYVAVWRTAFEQTLLLYPPDGGLTQQQSLKNVSGRWCIHFFIASWTTAS